MNIIIEKAQESDIDALSQFYDEVNDYLASHINYPEWKRGIYPAGDTAENAVLEGTAYAARENGRIIGSFILRQMPENGYEKADWHFPSDYDNIIVVYTLAVHPDYSGKGVGRQLVDFVVDYGRENGMKAVRLDVYEKNEPAIRLYQKCGFQYIDTVDLGYGKYGLDRFALFQKLL